MLLVFWFYIFDFVGVRFWFYIFDFCFDMLLVFWFYIFDFCFNMLGFIFLIFSIFALICCWGCFIFLIFSIFVLICFFFYRLSICVENILFAGEHCSELGTQCVSGAFETGMDVANWLLGNEKNYCFCKEGRKCEMIQCDKCFKWYHWSCVGITAELVPQGDYFCAWCKLPTTGNQNFEANVNVTNGDGILSDSIGFPDPEQKLRTKKQKIL